MTTTTAPTRCTIVVAGDGGTCGRPAVQTFTSARTGETFAECDHHAVPVVASAAAPIAAGASVRVRHQGIDKVGRVAAVRRTRCDVVVTVFAGSRRQASRTITVDIDEVRPA